MARRKDLSGMKFGRLTAVSYVYTQGKQSYWLCRCECGREKAVSYSSLTSGKTRSCGCLNSEVSSQAMKKMNFKHGHSREPLYIKWTGMISRCYKESDTHYSNYGGRGISVCADWKDDYESFRAWALSNGYQEGLSLDRINVNGNYCPENCRFIPFAMQARNKQNTHYLTIGGITKCIAEWSKESGVSTYTLLYRVRKGWSEERLLTPARPQRKRQRRNKDA